jgi:repressor LexA
MSQKSGGRFTESRVITWPSSIPTPSYSDAHPPKPTSSAISASARLVVTLERNGFIRRQPGVPRSIEILVPPESFPILEWLGIKTSKAL